ncbi:unnamed protein product [Linum tenue]|uniref:Protein DETOXIFICATION n=1 Tax=Linum tenue TaxID=586396 RepID=A0AAV0HYH4_9ROSI|nr:unnamed protein product [Linum tenue]
MAEKHDDEQLLVQRNSSAAAAASFVAGADDIPPITNLRDFSREFCAESAKLWFLAGPAIFTTICQYSLGAVTQVFAGQVGTLELAAVSVENSVIAGFSLGTMVDMLGVYLQRSWVILLATSSLLTLTYIFAAPLLRLIGQPASISRAAGTFAIWMLPQLFAYALNFPMAKFLQAQSKMAVMAGIATAALVLHAALNWALLVVNPPWGLAGAAALLDGAWWFIVAAQFVYVVGGGCGKAWGGFTWKAFRNLWGFVRLSLASAVMVCLEIWYFMVLILFAGYLKDAEVSVAALSIWYISHPRTARFSLVVAVVSSFMVGVALALVLVVTKDHYPSLFSNDPAVKRVVKDMTSMLALCIVINNVQPVLSGVAIGAGWQAVVAYVNIGCYYLFGIPLGLILGYQFDMGVMLMIGKTSGHVRILHAMQRSYSWVILTTTAFLLSFVYIFAAPFHERIGQTPETSRAAGTSSIYMLLHQFACAVNFPIAKFLQSQSSDIGWPVAIGEGWQAAVAFVSDPCYYAFGIPDGLIVGYRIHLGVKASAAENRIRRWCGDEGNQRDECLTRNGI